MNYKEKVAALTRVINSMVNMAYVRPEIGHTPRFWPGKPPTGFLKVANAKETEVFPLRKEELIPCLRCGNLEIAKGIGLYLLHFVCSNCLVDKQQWDFRKREGGISYTIEAMEADMLSELEAPSGGNPNEGRY